MMPEAHRHITATDVNRGRTSILVIHPEIPTRAIVIDKPARPWVVELSAGNSGVESNVLGIEPTLNRERRRKRQRGRVRDPHAGAAKIIGGIGVARQSAGNR